MINQIGETLIGQLLAISLLAAALTVIASLFLIRLYRRAVLRTMRKRSAPGPQARDGSPASTPPACQVVLDDHPVPLTPEAQRLQGQLLRAPRRSVWIYLAGALAYGLIMTVFTLTASGIGFNLRGLLSLMLTYCWPAVLIINQITVTGRRNDWRILAAYLAAAALVWVSLSLLAPHTFRIVDLLIVWGGLNLIPTILQQAFLHRRVRAIGPMVFTFLFLASAGALSFTVWSPAITLWIVENTSGLVRLPFLLMWNTGTTILIFLLVGIVITGLAGWWTLRILQKRYLAKRINDRSLTFDSIWLVFAFCHAIQLMSEGNAWFISGLAAFLAYKLVTAALFRWAFPRRKPEPDAPQLLILRVFALGRRSEQLYAGISRVWPYAGGIHFITGPDLVTATVEPHDFMDFLTGRLRRRFIDRRETLDRYLDERDTVRDPDGRFRTSDYFCYADTWTMVLARLARESDVILMDLRQFSAGNTGCAYEINEIVDHIRLDRVVFLVDRTTDEASLRQVFLQACRDIPPGTPNHGADPLNARILRLSGHTRAEFAGLLGALAAAATPPE